MTIPGVSTLHVITRALRNTPVPMTPPTTMAVAGRSPRPRTSVTPAGGALTWRLIAFAHSLDHFMALYLGFDSSTQSLTATVVEITPAARRVVAEHVLVFDEACPEYGTSRGVTTGADGRTVTAPPAMWAAALDLMMARLRDAGVDLSAVRAISGAAQQHGSVYLAAGAADTLRGLDPERRLVDQIGQLFSREVS